MAKVSQEILSEYQTLIPPKGSKNPKGLSEEEKNHARQLGEKRKAFLKAKAKELGISAQKLEKNIGKALKKQGGKKPKPKKAVSPRKDIQEETEVERSSTTLDRELIPPEKNTGRGGYYVNSPELLAEHLRATGGKWRTRFPPEPNGYLHIGHAKAMLVSFGVAARHGGTTIMRFDDTNPEAEKPEYIRSILASVNWLEHKYEKVTYTSDYFEEMYQLAEKLILMDKAYVCGQPQEEVKKSREVLAEWHRTRDVKEELLETMQEDKELFKLLPAGAYSPYRNRPVEESLRMFRGMRAGRYEEGEVTLRMKQNLLSPNANLWDQMAYRIMYKAHPHTGDEWCIYPTYDYSHCLIDSLENITHSLCSLEFESRQSTYGSYHWLVHSLGMYHAQTWEFSRCSISSNVMSKRRLNKLVTEGYVNGWDDPRLLTLDGLKRRGVTPEAVNNFCESIGVARSSNTVCIKYALLEHFVRKDLNENAERRFAIVDPIKLVIRNLSLSETKVPRFPQDPSRGDRKVSISSVVLIPRQKFRSDEQIAAIGKKGYKGLIRGGLAKLLYGPKVRCVSYTDEQILCEVVDEKVEGQAPAIPWVDVKTAVAVEANLFEPLFIDCEVDGIEVHAEKAAKAKGKDYLELLNPDSLNTIKIMVEESVKQEIVSWIKHKEKETVRWQFFTVGYFCIDLDSSESAIKLNRVVSLKESKSFRK